MLSDLDEGLDLLYEGWVLERFLCFAVDGGRRGTRRPGLIIAGGVGIGLLGLRFEDVIVGNNYLIVLLPDQLDSFLVDLIDQVLLDAELEVMPGQTLAQLVAEVAEDHQGADLPAVQDEAVDVLEELGVVEDLDVEGLGHHALFVGLYEVAVLADHVLSHVLHLVPLIPGYAYSSEF